MIAVGQSARKNLRTLAGIVCVLFEIFFSAHLFLHTWVLCIRVCDDWMNVNEVEGI